jgi:hypothetical protein
MSDTIANLVEAIEPENCLFDVIKRRALSIPSYETLGPPDLCYIVKE